MYDSLIYYDGFDIEYENENDTSSRLLPTTPPLSLLPMMGGR